MWETPATIGISGTWRMARVAEEGLCAPGVAEMAGDGVVADEGVRAPSGVAFSVEAEGGWWTVGAASPRAKAPKQRCLGGGGQVGVRSRFSAGAAIFLPSVQIMVR